MRGKWQLHTDCAIVTLHTDREDRVEEYHVQSATFTAGYPNLRTIKPVYAQEWSPIHHTTWQQTLTIGDVLSIIRDQHDDNSAMAIAWTFDGRTVKVLKHSWPGQQPAMEKIQKAHYVSPGA